MLARPSLLTLLKERRWHFCGLGSIDIHVLIQYNQFDGTPVLVENHQFIRTVDMDHHLLLMCKPHHSRPLGRQFDNVMGAWVIHGHTHLLEQDQ